MPTIDLRYIPRPGFRAFHLRTQKRACLVCHRRAGKTVALIADLVDHALRCGKPNGRFQLLAPLHKQVKDIAWTTLKEMTAPIPNRTLNESELWVGLPSQAGTVARVRLYGTDGNPDALRGLYSDGMALDEYADMNPLVWESIVLPALADRDGFLVVSGTPKGHNAFYQRYQDSLRDNRWYCLHLKASQSGILSASVLKDLAREMPPAKYAQEMECDFSQGSTAQFIPTELVEQAALRQATAGIPMPRVLGVDVARFGDDCSVILTRRGRLVEDLKRYHKNDLVTLANEVMAGFDQVRPQMIYVDGAGVGGGVVDYLASAGYPVRDVQVGGAAGDKIRYLNKRAELWGEMRHWLATAQLQLPVHELALLTADLLGPKYSYTLTGQIALERKQDMKKRGMPSPDAADALALTFFERLAPVGLAVPDLAEDAEEMDDVW